MPQTLIGAAWIVSAMALIAFADNFVPLVAERMGLWQFHLLRSGLLVPIAIGAAAMVGGVAQLWPDVPGRVAQRTAFHAGALMLYFAALPSVGISVAAAGMFTSPIWVTILAALFFGERVGPRRVLAALIGFVGVCLVLGIGQAPLRPMGIVAMGAGLAYALGVIWTRQHCMAVPSLTLAVWQFGGLGLAGAVGLVLAPHAAPFLSGIEGTELATMPWQTLDALGWVLILGLGTAGIIATGCLATGYKKGKSSVMGLFDFAFLFWAPLFGWMLWGDRPTSSVVAGMALIVAAGVLAVWSGRRAGAVG